MKILRAYPNNRIVELMRQKLGVAKSFLHRGKPGRGNTGSSSVPVQVHDGEQTPGQSYFLEDIVAVSGGNYHVLALDEYGNVWAWGRGSYGQLGDGKAAERIVKILVERL